MIVLVDMDDVLEKLVEGWTQYNNNKFGTKIDPDEIDSWQMDLFFPGFEDRVYDAEKDDALWDLVKPMPGAVENVKKIIDDGHEVYVVSATYHETLKAKMEKVLFKYFPYLDWKHVILTHHKELVKGDVLIDDGPHNLVGDRPYRKVLFTANHNKRLDEKSIGAVRVNNWDEAYEEIKRIEKEIKNK